MYTSNKVIWQDGMFLHPHHFQQQDIYYENMLSEYYLLKNSENWGIITLEIDFTALKLNKILIKNCIGVFPNGTLFSIPYRDSLPCPIDIPKNYSNKLVYLGLPVGYSCNLNLEAKKVHFRYSAVEQECIDTNTISGNKKSIIAGKLNLSMLLENDESKDQFILLPILKIADANDGVVIEKNYIPPCLQVKSDSVLQGYINIVLGLLNNYLSSKISRVHGETTPEINQVQNLLILQTVNRFKYLFELSLHNQSLSPYTLFEKIVSLISSMIVFSKNYSLEHISTKYNNLDIINSLEPLINLLISMFDELGESAVMEMDFKLESSGIYSLNVPNISSIDNSNIIIGIEFTEGFNKESINIVNSIKIAARGNIERVVALHVSGITITSISHLPFHIPHSKDILYLKINPEGSLWEQVITNKDIAIYVNSQVIKVKSIKLWLLSLADR
jgi:type VI secretion system protein ImpJ